MEIDLIFADPPIIFLETGCIGRVIKQEVIGLW